MNEPHWTKKPPTEDGYYWHRESVSHFAFIRHVHQGLVKYGFDVRGNVSDYGGEWYGPLEPPGGDAVEGD